MKKYIKLNDNDNYLSLGNVFNIIKKIAVNKTSAIQTEIFCTIFSVDNISDTTVGNYCTGYRSIGNSYKQIYINYHKKYQKDKTILLKVVNNLTSLLSGTIQNYHTISEINDDYYLQKLCKSIHILIKNDLYIKIEQKKELLNLLNNNDYYLFISEVLFYIILEKEQPIYAKDLVNTTIESILEKTNLSITDLKAYLEVEFNEGISQISSLKKLANLNNPYAIHKLASLEYNGIIAGYPRYEKAYEYYKQAASFNHPNSNWMVAHILLNEKIAKRNKDDIKTAWDYLNKALELGSISAINTIGLCYLNGWTIDGKKNLNKAKEYFIKAAEKNYIYAYNNLGKIYENEKNYKLAFQNYLQSANEEDSWACNKIGLFYYYGLGTKKDYQKSFEYFNLGMDAPINERINWNTFNLVDLFYLKGNNTLGISKGLDKSLTLLNTIKNFKPSSELFLYCYYELYLLNKNNEYLEKVKYYLNILNTNIDNKKKKEIESSLNNIYEINIKL